MVALPAEGECPVCATRVLLDRRGRCVWCDHPIATPPSKRPKARANVNRGVPVLMGDDVLERAHEMHQAGASLRQCARELLAGTGYASEKSLVMALGTQFRHRGWYVRHRIEATVKASTVHGRARRGQVDPAYRHEGRLRRGEIAGVICAGVLTQGPDKGQRCRRAARAGSEYCRVHDPARREQVLAEAANARAAQRKAAA